MSECAPEERKTFLKLFRVLAWGWKWPPLFIGLVFAFSPLLYFMDSESLMINYSALPKLFLFGCLILVVWYVIYRCIPNRLKSYKNEESSNDKGSLN